VSISKATAAEVHERSDGFCEACGGRLGAYGGVFHHRKLRSRGGRDDAVNLMEVHPVCHNGHRYSIHGAPDRSERLGHMVASGKDPAAKSVTVCPALFKTKK
jgi:HNH endonuclease